MVPLFDSMALCHELIIQLFFGSDFSEAGLLLSIMLLAVMFITVPVAAVNRLNSVGTHGPECVALAATAGLGTSAIAWIALGPTLGVTGVAIGYVLGPIVSGIFQVARAWRVGRQAWSDIPIWLAATQDLPTVWGVVSAAILPGGWLAVHFRTLTKLRRPAS